MTVPLQAEGGARPPGADRLACRLAAALSFVATVVFVVVLLVVVRLPVVSGGYALPGTTRTLGPGIVFVLAGCAGAAMLCGSVVLGLGRLPFRLDRQTPPIVVLPSWRRIRRPTTILLAGLAALIAVLMLKR